MLYMPKVLEWFLGVKKLFLSLPAEIERVKNHDFHGNWGFHFVIFCMSRIVPNIIGIHNWVHLQHFAKDIGI